MLVLKHLPDLRQAGGWRCIRREIFRLKGQDLVGEIDLDVKTVLDFAAAEHGIQLLCTPRVQSSNTFWMRGELYSAPPLKTSRLGRISTEPPP